MSKISEFFNSQANSEAKTNAATPARKRKATCDAQAVRHQPSASTNSPAKARRAAGKHAQPAICEPLSTNSNPPEKAVRREATESLKAVRAAPLVSTSPAKKRGRPARNTLEPALIAPGVTHSDGQFTHEIQGARAIGKRRSKGRKLGGTHEPDALAAATHSEIGGHSTAENHELRAANSDHGGRFLEGAQSAHAPVVAQIQYLWRMRQRWHKAEKALILQGKALCRSIVGGDKKEGSALFDKAAEGGEIDEATALALAPFIASIEQFSKPRAKYERELAKLTRQLPAYEFVLGVRGVGEQSFAAIVGEAGDVGSYKTVSALWKRMGLAVFDGQRQMKRSNVEEALLHGYNPSRRSVMWNIGNGLIGGMGRGPRPSPGEDISTREDWTVWQKLFVERCRYECAREPERFPLATVEKDDEQRESYPKIVQARAKRYVEKRFLRKLYAAWRKDVLGASGDPDDEIALPMAAE